MQAKDILNSYKQGKLTTAELKEKLARISSQQPEKKQLSEGQKGIWLLEKVSPEMSAYNLPICYKVKEKIDKALLEQALNIVREQHPILKTAIEEEKGVPYQTINNSQPLLFETRDISELEKSEVLPYLKKIAREPFELSTGPLMRAYLFHSPQQENIVLINIHHIIFDGVSIGVFLTALLDAYIDLLQGRKPAEQKSSHSFYDFVDWEQEMLSSTIGEEHRIFWKKQLSGSLPVLELATDGKRHSADPFKGDTHTLKITGEQLANIRAFVESERISLPTFFLGALNVMLYQHSNQEEIVVGMASIGRSKEEFEALMGYFINVVPIRSNMDVTKDFLTLTKDLQFSMLDAMQHSDYPFSAMVKDLNLPRSLTNSPVFQVGYFYQNFIQAHNLSQLSHYKNTLHVEMLDEVHQEGEYELTLEVFEHETELQIKLKYNPDLYQVDTISRLTQNLVRIASEAVAQKELPINEYSMLSAEDENKVIKEWNATEEEYPKDKCVQELFEQQAKATPKDTAVLFENESYTYQELDERSTKLAIYLQKMGVGPETFVGISMERSLDMIVGLMGILKAGGAYVPLDPGYPVDRLKYMITNSNVSIVLSQSSLMDKMEQLLDNNTQAIPLDGYWEKIKQTVDGNDVLERKVTSENLAYVIYTSGSTGNPKGVMIPHAALTNFLLTMGNQPGLTSDDTLLAVTTYCFDIAGLELFLPLIKGAKCQICSTEKQKNIEKLKQEIARVKPTIMQATPATWTALFQTGWNNQEKVKVLCGGEALPEKLKTYFTDSQTEIWNMFGPTETTIWSTIKRISEKESITIGKPIANTQIYILNENKKPVPIGVPGELYIGGDGLARGYLHLKELTEDRFIENPFISGAKIYKTGDSARWLNNGEIEFIGRIDNQVKLHGFRIELDEIETRLNAHPAIKESTVVISERNGNKQLRAFYVTKSQASGSIINIKELRTFLQKTLPVYMVPNVFTEIDAIPLTPNGKVNRLELSNYSVKPEKEEKKPTMQLSEMENILLDIWKDVIGIDELTVDDGFFEVGGDSFTAVTAADRISAKFDCEIKVTTIFEHINIKGISKHISEIKNIDIEPPTGSHEEIEIARSSEKLTELEEASDSLPDYYDDSIAIIGISCQFPGAKNTQQFWENLREGKESVQFFTKEELAELQVPEEIINNPNYVPLKLTIDGKELFDPEFFNISPKDAERMDPQMRLLLLNSWKAVEDAGYVSNQIPDTAVYMSTSNNYYHATNDSKDVNVISDSNQYVTWLLGQGGTVPTMVSYQLGFKGPSYSIHSNCSSSLVGLYSAYQSLRSGEVEYALVGASTIHSSTSAGHVHVPGLNFSSDGHLKAFDASADGMVGGEGVAVILLKNAKKAVKDNDNIYALLRGISLNNDGTEKIGFYAPSIQGQANVIKKALETTQINPETIGYVEAHGTGTKLGDPIEIAALSSVYKKYTQKKNYCGIGSVKTNVGHLDTAAGLAGCIKIALGMSKNQIPPTLNYNESNPDIDLKNSPFYLVDELQDLKQQAIPFRAALSSFGIGGTNAHAIFEKYVPANEELHQTEPANQHACLVPLSAKSESRLKEYATELHNYLNKENNQAIQLENLAYTLQVGRQKMDCRVVFQVKNSEELIQKLEGYLGGQPRVENCFEMKVGQPQSSLQLLEEDEDSNDLILKWISKGKLDKIAMLWVNGFEFDWELLYAQSSQPQRISLPTYPFAKEKFWKSKQKGAIAGTSIQGKGAVKLHPLIERNVSDFSEQKYATKLQGTEFFLEDHVIDKKKILPGVTYIEMGKVAGELATNQLVSKVKNVVWARPIVVENPCELEIVLVPQGSEIEYKVRTIENDQYIVHSQGKLEFGPHSDSISENTEGYENVDIKQCKENSQVYISHKDFYEADDAPTVYEYGVTFRPIKEMYVSHSEVLSYIELPAERENDFNRFTLHPSLLEGCLQTVVGLMKTWDVTPFMPFSIDEIELIKEFPKKCFVHATLAEDGGSNVDTTKFNIKLVDTQGQLIARIKNYSIRSITATLETVQEGTKSSATVLYRNVWKKQEARVLPKSNSETILVFDTNGGIWDGKDEGDSNILVKPGSLYREVGNSTYEIASGNPDDYHKLFNSLKEKDIHPGKIVYNWLEGKSDAEINTLLRDGIYSIHHLTKLLMELDRTKKVKLQVIFNQENSLLSATTGAIGGYAKTLQIENPRFFFKTVQLQMPKEQAKEIVMAEFEMEDSHEVLYNEQGRHVKQLKEKANANGSRAKAIPFKNEGVYIITGGMGGLGLILAQYLVKTLQVKVVLIGRSDIDGEKTEIIEELNSSGSEVIYVKADVAVQGDIENVLGQAKSRFGNVNGIIHCAGLLKDSFIQNKAMEDLEAVISPKVNGTVILDEVFKNEKLDFFALYSSTSHLGNPGQSDYAYANSFLNYFADYREQLVHQNSRWGKSVSINWPIWEEGGMQMSQEALKLMEQVNGLRPINAVEGIRVLEESLLQDYSQVIVFYGDSAKIRLNNVPQKEEPKVEVAAPEQPQVAVNDNMLFEKVKQYLIQSTTELLKTQDVDIDMEMEQYGFDSISQTELANKINSEYQLDIMPTIFFELEQPTLRCLGNHLCDKHSEKLSVHYQGKIKAKPVQNNKPVTKKPLQATRPQNQEAIQVKEGFNLKARFAAPQPSQAVLHSTPRHDEPIAIIGMNGIFPQSENLDEFWENLEAEKYLVTEIPEDRFDWKSFNDKRIKWGGFINDVDKFDAKFFGMSSFEAEVMDPQHRLFLQVAWGTFEDAGYKPSELSGSNTGIFVGIGTQDYSQLMDRQLAVENPYALTGRTPFMLVNRISSMLNLHGPSEPVDTACSSSLLAVHKAAEAIRNGACNMALAGGVNIILTPEVHISFSAAGMLSDDGLCKVFDKDANGTLRSEGVGSVLLKKLSDAIADGDNIHAVLKSSASNHNGKSASLTAPNANAQTDLLVEAYTKANIEPQTIGYIETHSTGGKLGDPIEITGLQNAFTKLNKNGSESSSNQYCGIGSLKSSAGHMETAAGIGSFIKTILSIKNETLLPMLHFKELNPYIKLENSPFYVLKEARQWSRIAPEIPRRAGVSAFGFGGVNAHAVVEEYMPQENKAAADAHLINNPALIVLSAKNKDRLTQQAKLLLDFVQKKQFKDSDLLNIGFTLQMGREAFEERLAFSVASVDELEDKLSRFVQNNSLKASDICHGTVNANDDLFQLLAGDEGIDNVIDQWLQQKEYNKILNFWVKGLSINWNKLYLDIQPRRVSLPSYPFEKTRHWLPNTGKKELNIDLKHTEDALRVTPDLLENNPKFPNLSQDNTETKEIVFNVFSKLLGIDAKELDHNKSMADIGIDSIILTQLLQKLQVIDPDIDFEVLYNCDTINEILKVVSMSNNGTQEVELAEEAIESHVHYAESELGNGNIKAVIDKAVITNTNAIMSEVLEKQGIRTENKVANVQETGEAATMSIITKYPELVRLNKANKKRPVFWIHGGFGGVEIYRIIAQKINRPFYGVQAKGYMTEDEPINGIEDMAAHYVNIIREAQPEGPYDLGGLSLGGMIAYEVARQLKEQGQQVNSIIMLESIYVNEEMKEDWLAIPTESLKKDRMFRAVNLLLSFASTNELVLIQDKELNQEVSDDDLLEQLVQLALEKGISKSAEQLRKSIIQLEKILNTLDMSTTFYDALPMTDSDSVQSYYFCNTNGELFGENESYFRLVDKGRFYDYIEFSNKWKQVLPALNTLKVEASSHLTLLTEPQSQDTIIGFCKKLYEEEKITEEYLSTLSI